MKISFDLSETMGTLQMYALANLNSKESERSVSENETVSEVNISDPASVGCVAHFPTSGVA